MESSFENESNVESVRQVLGEEPNETAPSQALPWADR
jgi:hypothetical protein